MSLDIAKLLRENRLKWRLISQRELREWVADQRDYLPCSGDRQERDLLKRAYEAGLRDASP